MKGCVDVPRGPSFEPVALAPGPRLASAGGAAGGGMGGSSGGGGYLGGGGDGDLGVGAGDMSRPHRAVRPILL